MSSKRLVKTGVPQGSVLSPLLFAVLMYDLPNFCNARVLVQADDVTFLVSGSSVLEAQAVMQGIVDSFLEWTDKWGLSINPNKSRVMCFTNKRVFSIPEVKIGDEVIPFVTRHKFLGMILDGPRLSWKHHVEYLKITCNKRLDIMKRIAGTNWGSCPKGLIIFYKAFIRSKLDYGCEAYGSASKTLLAKLDVIQNTALRIAIGAFRSSPILSIHCESNVIPLSYWRDERLIKWYAKIRNNCIDHSLFQSISINFQLLHRMNWTSGRQVPAVIRACYFLSSLNLSWGNFPPLPVATPIPPWVPLTNYFNTDFPVSKSSCSVEIKNIFKAICSENYEDFVEIYTDGSLLPTEGSCTAAICIPILDFNAVWKLNSNSIVAAELLGILKALQFSLQFLYNSKIVIFTDSKISLSFIKNY